MRAWPATVWSTVKTRAQTAYKTGTDGKNTSFLKQNPHTLPLSPEHLQRSTHCFSSRSSTLWLHPSQSHSRMRPLQCHTTFTLASSTVSPCLLRLSYDGPCFLALHRPQLVQHIVCVFAPRKGSPPLSLRRVYYLPRVRAELVRGAQMAPYFGLYGQQAFLIITVDACVVQDAIKSGEGTSSGPMLFVAGFGPKVLESHIAKINSVYLQAAHLFVMVPRHSSLPNLPRRSFAKSRRNRVTQAKARLLHLVFVCWRPTPQ